MKVTITTPKVKTEFDVPDKYTKLVRTLLHELAIGVKSTPEETTDA